MWPGDDDRADDDYENAGEDDAGDYEIGAADDFVGGCLLDGKVDEAEGVVVGVDLVEAVANEADDSGLLLAKVYFDSVVEYAQKDEPVQDVRG